MPLEQPRDHWRSNSRSGDDSRSNSRRGDRDARRPREAYTVYGYDSSGQAVRREVSQQSRRSSPAQQTYTNGVDGQQNSGSPSPPQAGRHPPEIVDWASDDDRDVGPARRTDGRANGQTNGQRTPTQDSRMDQREWERLWPQNGVSPTVIGREIVDVNEDRYRARVSLSKRADRPMLSPVAHLPS